MGKPAKVQAKRRGDFTPADLAAEIVRRAGGRAVVHLREPPTPIERLQMLAARPLRRPIAILPHPCKTTDQWMERYATGGTS
jgi:hypothetical protein